MELNFVAPAAKNGEKVVLVSDEDIASGVKTWENALVGYVWGPIPSTEYDMPIDRLFLDKLILKFVDLECRNYGNVKFYSKGLGVYLFDFESFEAKQLVSDKGGVLNNSYRWGTPTATCPKQFSWSEAFHIPISKVFEQACYGEFSSLRCFSIFTMFQFGLSPLSLKSPFLLRCLCYYMVEFAAAMPKLARLLAGVLAENLGHPRGVFESTCQESNCFLRLNRYPACPISSEISGLVPHTDSDYLTILSEDEVGGLQLMKDSKWVAVKPNPDALIVNIGDLSQTPAFSVEMVPFGEMCEIFRRLTNPSILISPL
ncbi:gibberellin 2-beta-dioxygenase 6-like [Populus nigra]|uniref:gibberellin 2-beta-dioxygenase 6-like n=1 Tax=Populus nigra TaxID=3691 RepID=UPI002B26EB95|nr:gibberellin 2-beta-dioxygenase 6-like [Populus nigra]